MLRIRKGMDGSFWIARSCSETEAYMDAIYRRAPNQLKWFSKKTDVVSGFKNLYLDNVAYIVGKGPSLDLIRANCFTEPSAPILCINESVLTIEKLSVLNDVFGTQLDNEIEESCKPTKLSTKMFLGPMCANLYLDGVYRYDVDPASFGLGDCISAQYAIMIARHMGCTRLELFCFDSCTTGALDYAKCVGYDSAKGGPKNRFLEHKEKILQTANKMPLTWVTPRAGNTVSRIDSL